MLLTALVTPYDDGMALRQTLEAPTAHPYRTDPGRGLLLFTFPGCPLVEVRTVVATLANPKSDSLATVTFASTRTLRLLTSMCITPRECRYSSP